MKGFGGQTTVYDHCLGLNTATGVCLLPIFIFYTHKACSEVCKAHPFFQRVVLSAFIMLQVFAVHVTSSSYNWNCEDCKFDFPMHFLVSLSSLAIAFNSNSASSSLSFASEPHKNAINAFSPYFSWTYPLLGGCGHYYYSLDFKVVKT